MRTTIGIAVLSFALLGDQSPEPRISGIAPETPMASEKAQVLTVTGEGFGAGLTLFVTTPGGAVKSLTGSDLSNQKGTSFQVSLSLAEVGRYSFVVVTEKGPRSTAFVLEVRGRGKGPWIDEVMPAEFSRSRDVQMVTIAGRNFAPGLRVSLSDPAGNVTLIWRKRTADSARRFDLVSRRYTAGSWTPQAPQAAAVLLEDNTANSVFWPTLAVGTGGTAVATWYFGTSLTVGANVFQ